MPKLTKIMQELMKDPSSVFEFEAKLPSGVKIGGTLGPMVAGKVSAQILFDVKDPSEDDLRLAKSVLDELMGKSADFAKVSRTPQEHEETLVARRRFMGGAQG